MQFYIEEFYRSVSKELLLKALTYGKSLVNISDEEINTIINAFKKSLLFYNADIWIKKNGDPDFIKVFKEDFDLSITCETNLKAVNLLDVTLNLTTGKKPTL